MSIAGYQRVILCLVLRRLDEVKFIAKVLRKVVWEKKGYPSKNCSGPSPYDK